ncbi:hypothetical protein DESC_220005 [Desulfosarcina cetonica]|nr:hypothetical protein DESC_220005 [Desulfosarcina cetonica]
MEIDSLTLYQTVLRIHVSIITKNIMAYFPKVNNLANKTLQPTRGASGFSEALGFGKNLASTTCSAICPGRLSSPLVLILTCFPFFVLHVFGLCLLERTAPNL